MAHPGVPFSQPIETLVVWLDYGKNACLIAAGNSSGMSPLKPQLVAVTPPPLVWMYHTLFEGRKMAMSVLPSPL